MEPLAAMAAVATEHSLRQSASHEMRSPDSVSANDDHRRRLMRRNSTGSSRKGFLSRSNSKSSHHTLGSNRSLSTAGTNDSGRSDKSHNRHLKSSRKLQRRSSLSSILSRGKHKSNNNNSNTNTHQNNHVLATPQSQIYRNKTPSRKVQRRSSLSNLLRRSGGDPHHKEQHAGRKGGSTDLEEDSQYSNPSQELLLKQSVSSSSSTTVSEKRRKPIHRTSSLPTFHKQQQGIYSNAELMMSVLQHPNDPDNIYHQQQKRAQSTARHQQRKSTVTDWDTLRSPSVARSKTAGRRRASATSSMSTYAASLSNNRTSEVDFQNQHHHQSSQNTMDMAPPPRNVRRTASLDATQSLLDLHLEQQKRQPPLYNGFTNSSSSVTKTKNHSDNNGEAIHLRRQQRRHLNKETESVTNATEMSSTASSWEYVRETGRGNEAR